MMRRTQVLAVCVALALLSISSIAATIDESPAEPPESEDAWRKHLPDEPGADEPITHAKVAPTAVVSLGPSAAAAMTGALFFPGAGHFYVGGDATQRGTNFLIGEVVSLAAFIGGTTTVTKDVFLGPDEEQMAAPALALAGILAFVGLKIYEIVDAGRSADAARMELVLPAQPRAVLLSEPVSTYPEFRLTLASF